MVFIPDVCFDLIKEFAGIYSISTDWNEITQIPLHCLHYKLYILYLKLYNKKLPILYKKTANLRTKKLCIVKHCIAEFNSKSLWIQLNDLLQKQITLPHVIIGSEVTYFHQNSIHDRHPNKLGIVTKVNKKSIRVTPCKLIFVSKEIKTIIYSSTWQETKQMSVYNWDKTTVAESIRINKYEIETTHNQRYFKNITFYSDI
jgi:hypothetical protein